MNQNSSTSDATPDADAQSSALTKIQSLKFVVFLLATMATGWASFYGRSFDLLVYIMLFCISLGGTIGTLNNRTWRGCLLGFAGFVLGLVVLVVLAPGVQPARE